MIFVITASILTCTFIFTGCSSNGNYSNSKYTNILDESEIFANAHENAIAQTEIAKKIQAHVESGDNKKALYIAYDGARADLLFNITQAKGKEGEVVTSEDSLYSGINAVKKTGGLYLGYTGGDTKKKETLQESSTIPGFATLLTGVWADEHKVYTNNSGDDRATDTILLKLAQQNKKVSFNARWDAYFDSLFKKEFDKNTPNYTVNKTKDTDFDLYNDMQNAINRGDDLIFGILENTDYKGHDTFFGNESNEYVKAFFDCDMYAYALVQAVLERESLYDEDWLVVITTDHGGHKKTHGTKSYTDTTIFIACNKEIF